MVKCNKCGSFNIRKLSVIYDEQTSISYESGTIRSLNFRGRFNNKIVNQTKLASQIAPPIYPQGKKLKVIFIAVTTFVIALIIGTIIKHSFLILIAFYTEIAFSIYGIYRDIKTLARKKKTYQHELTIWHKSYHCWECGNIFT